MYPSADLLVSSWTRYGVRLITPMLADTSPQARAGHGFDHTGFTIDGEQSRVICPTGQTNASWTPAVQRGTEAIVVKFPGAVCRACPVQATCTTATRGGRQLTLRPQPIQEALDEARAEQSRPRHSTSSASMPGGTERSSTPAEPPIWHAWNSPSQPDPRVICAGSLVATTLRSR